MAKRGPEDAEIDALDEQMRNLRKKLKKLRKSEKKTKEQTVMAASGSKAMMDNKESDGDEPAFIRGRTDRTYKRVDLYSYVYQVCVP